MNIKKLGLVSLFSTIGMFCSAGNAGAVGLIFSPTGATVNSGGTSIGNIQDTYNHVGLTTGFTSGATDFDTAVSQNKHSKTTGEWFSGSLSGNATITYNLGSVLKIDRLALWNEDLTGIGKLNLAYSTDNINFSSLATGLTPTNNPIRPVLGTYAADVFAFAAKDAQYVRFDASQCPPQILGGGVCSIGEVAFSGTNPQQVPEPSGMVGTSLLAVGFIGRKIWRNRQHQSGVLK
jgi:hypothetical protein